MVEIQPVERGELVAGHRRLGHERAGLEDQHVPPGRGELPGDDAGTGPRADDDDVGLEAHVAVGAGAGSSNGRIGVGWDVSGATSGR